MNIKSIKIKCLFKDKATLILRTLLATPNFKWSVRSLAKTSQTSLGLVSRVVNLLKGMDCINSGGRGRGGFNIIQHPETLLRHWTQHYDFALNSVSSFHLSSPKDAQKFFAALKELHIRHALTLHSGANLLTRYFVTDQQYLYIDSQDIENLVIQLSNKIPITRLARGGNLHLISPYYKNSAFDKMRFIKGLPVVSNLQLYLDLFHFSQRGHDHAIQLCNVVGDKLYE